jgi:hypothetical protein
LASIAQTGCDPALKTRRWRVFCCLCHDVRHGPRARLA